MKKIKDGNTYNVNIPTYYVETDEELAAIPVTEPAGTIVEYNGSEFKVLMKKSDGSWKEL